MAGYGNVNAPDLSPSDLETQHSETRFGRDDSHPYSNPHETYGSGTTGGAGFEPRGNKSASDAPIDTDNSHFRFGSHQDTSPYSGGTRHGSGSTGGAGYGNKTGSFSKTNDSTLGKVIEKVGHVVKNEGLVEKGHKKRVEAGLGRSEGELEGKYEAN
ncbi:uncharacterized protein CC84DRAFT_1176776 [Paraphaeosphaeria sporulosa]|uniref:CsbD-like domain-containing protein n=1 Tax=Paraphaeosphaeria sporulosa TaxID=1460663 RepID=A0A177CA04_9PLEO|nr:uncharacterized protein CC84DRAFT_1176776 [Paraphaeosphaeria sporulosa]OAG04574.1 hypothetical protein CC84DRAFT_1176776 [Paraphaeosphaeria sporulosa]